MRRILIIVNIVFVVIMVANFVYYKDLYKKQVNYIFELLNRQVQIVGFSVDETNNGFETDVNQINFEQDLIMFFSDKEKQKFAIDKMKLFFSKYEEFVTGIKYYDNKKNEFTLKKDAETGEWLPSPPFVLHVQPEIYDRDTLIQEKKRFNYLLPVIDVSKDQTVGNLVVSVDFQKYFDAIFNTFNLQDYATRTQYQWQWVLSDSGEVIFDNYPRDMKITYSQIDRIKTRLAEGSVDNITHSAEVNGKRKEIISSFYSTQLLKRDLGLVFSAPTDFFQKYIIRNSIFIVTGTLLLIQFIVFIFWNYLRSQKKEMERLRNSEKMLFKLIDEMPVGVIIHNKNREIIKSNKVAAEQYSYNDEKEMQGKIFPETAHPNGEQFPFSDPVGRLDPSQFVVIKKEIGEIVLYRKSIPVTFMEEDAIMEMLIDVTLLESARKHEVKANEAKSEFLARMSYEIRTPLNGIIGMTDVLFRFDLSDQVKEIVRLLRSSTEVLLNIINDILDFSRIETGKMILDDSPFNLKHEIDYCIDLAKANIAPNTINLVATVDDRIPKSMIGDPFRLRQIITNLINHSIKNTERGEIRLNCRLKNRKDGVITLEFELLDNGLSFDKSAFKRMFGDFVNSETPTVKSNDESSFGTILARQLAELMGGDLTAESPSGIDGDKGTKIIFHIVTYSNERITKTLNKENIRSFENIRTLAITGNQNRDEETLSALNRMGLNVTVTTFMKMTVSQLKANLNFPDDRYSLIVIFDEEDFDGFEVARSIWDNNLSKNFEIILISSNDVKGNYIKSITLGVDHYVVKPLTESDLVNVIRNSFPNIGMQPSTAPAVTFRSDLRILIVEDNKMNQKVIGTMLANLGYTADIADDGYEGQLKARAKKYDLIFMDLVMPEMDGFEAARKILKADASVIIIAFTADNLPETRKKAELSGITDFISKPVRIDELKKLFAKHFRK
jgi:signal transduction histidine kinase/CheY-like chemotaxis protein